MTGRLPPDAFEVYAGLGAGRSYQAVAEQFGVSKRAVTKLAAREGWQRQIEELEARAKQGAERKVLESLQSMNLRHLKSLKVVQAKALQALQTMPLSTAMEAVRALDMAIKQERLIRGEPSDRTAVTVEETIRQEYARWMGPGDEEHHRTNGRDEPA